MKKLIGYCGLDCEKCDARSKLESCQTVCAIIHSNPEACNNLKSE